MASETIQIEKTGGIVVLRINRPPANAIDLQLANDFHSALESIEESSDVSALIITGEGSCFSAGLDLKAVPSYDTNEQQAMVMNVNRLFGQLYGLRVPTIAAVNGHAIAGGLILALACDYRIAPDGDYKLGLAEVRVGVPFPVAAMSIVKSELSNSIARMLVLTGRNSSAREALSRGILDEVEPADRLLARSMEVAKEMSALPRSMYVRIKRQLRANALAKIDDAIRHRKEPMLDSWLDEETRVASAQALKREK